MVIILSRVRRLETEFGLVIGFIGLLQNVTAGNYNHLISFRALQFTTTRTKSSQYAASAVIAW
jgi:hypothetical protein